ncbi:hypothetical protein GGQ84_000158 [Desulfitispora alkaliphila]
MALLIALVEFPAIFKKRKYFNLVVVFSIWFMGTALALYQAIGYETPNLMDALIKHFPTFTEPILDIFLE